MLTVLVLQNSDRNKENAQKLRTLFTKSSIKTLNVQHVRQYVT